MRVGEGYSPDMGFLLRSDFERISPKIAYRPRVDRFGFRNLFFQTEIDYYGRESTSEMESRKVSVSFFGGGTHREDGFGLSREMETEKLFEPFEIQPGIVIPPGLYSFDGFRVGGRTNERRLISFRGRMTSGEFFDGTRDFANVVMRVRASKHLRAETSFDYNDVSLPGGDFVTRIFGQRFGVSFTPDLRINAFVQYNDAAELVGANVRFNWIYKPGADLFLVYNESWDAPTFSVRERNERQLILKFTYLLQG